MRSSPTKIRQETLATLRGTRRDMSTATWLRSVAAQPLEVQRETAYAMLDVEQAILAMGNEKLASIGLHLKENEAALLAGRAALIKARKRLTQVRVVLAAIAKMLDVVAKVVKFPTGLAPSQS